MGRTPKIEYKQSSNFDDVFFAYDHDNQHAEFGGYDSYYGFGTGGPLSQEETTTKLPALVGTVVLAHAALSDEAWFDNPAASTLTWRDADGTYHILRVE